MDSRHFEKVWTNAEWEVRITFASVHCARIGYENWFQEEHERFHTQMTMFDDQTTWLSRPDSPKPLSEDDWTQRRKLLASLQDQFSRFVSYIQTQDQQMRQSVAE